MLNVSNDYIGKIVNAELQEKDGKVSAVVIVRPDGDTQTARWFGSFSDTVIQKGDNTGKVVGEMTAATLGKFGCTDFSKIEQLIGMPVAFGVKHRIDDKDRSKVWADVNFIRPPGSGKPATAAGLAGLNRFRGAAIAAAKDAPKLASKTVNHGSGNDSLDDQFDDQFDPLA